MKDSTFELGLKEAYKYVFKRRGDVLKTGLIVFISLNNSLSNVRTLHVLRNLQKVGILGMKGKQNRLTLTA